MEDIVAEHEATRVPGEEGFADDESLSQPVRLRLNLIGERHAPLLASAEETFETSGIFGRSDDQYFADSSKHQHRQRIVDHRFVVDRQQLLRHRMGEGMEARARPSGEDYSLAR